MNDYYLLQVSSEELEWFTQQPDFTAATEDFLYSNSITYSSSPDEPSRAIVLEDYDADLLMTSINPPLEGWFSPEEMLFSRALVYGKQEIDPEQNLTYNSPTDVAIIASELENLPIASLRVIFEEGTVRYGMPNTPPHECNEEILRHQSALFKWVTVFYQSARVQGYGVLIRVA